MKHLLFFRSVLFSIILTIVLAAPVSAQSQMLPKDQVIEDDYYAAGETVTVSGTVQGDAYVAGGTVIIDGNIEGDAMVAGGNVTINGEIGQDLRIAGGNVTINGVVTRNLTAAGGDVQLGKSGSVQGNILGMFGNFEQYGTIGGKATLLGGNAVLNAQIANGVDAKVGKLSLGESAQIDGNLSYTSEETASIAPNASVSGMVQFTKSPVDWANHERREERERSAVAAWSGFKVASAIFDFITTAIIGLFFLRLMPMRMLHMTELIRANALKSWGIGLIVLVLSPAVLLFLIITIVGIPLSALLFFGLVALYMLAKIPVVYFLGRYIMGKMNNGDRRGWAFIAGLAIYILITLVPFVGWIVKFITLPLGIGTLLMEKKYFYDLLQQKKMV